MNTLITRLQARAEVDDTARDAAIAAVTRGGAASRAVVDLEGALLCDALVAQRALAALIARELDSPQEPGARLVALEDESWGVEVPSVPGAVEGALIVPRIMDRDVDAVWWEARPRLGRDERRYGAPLCAEQLGVSPQMVFVLLDLLAA